MIPSITKKCKPSLTLVQLSSQKLKARPHRGFSVDQKSNKGLVEMRNLIVCIFVRVYLRLLIYALEIEVTSERYQDFVNETID